ncbi:MAG: hypothetical protein JWN40_1834 [Phycisphaerales bacterium]|nr:hypothetical protein [Phycisphaerales bacterium]
MAMQMLAAGGVRAGDLFFDSDGLAPLSAGSGQWDNSLPVWASSSAADATFGPWQGDSNAVFTGPGGTIALTDAVNVGGIDVRSGNYFLQNLGSGGFTWSLSPSTIKVATGARLDLLPSAGGSGGLTKMGGGTFGIYRAAILGGPVNINEGTLQFLGASADIPPIGTGTAFSAVTVAAGATFDFKAINDTIGSIAGAGTVKLGTLPGLGTTTGSQFTAGGDNTTTEFSGSILGDGGQFFKAGTGTLTLSGANTFNGRVGVQAGTLVVSGGSAIGDLSDVFISANSTLRLASNERIGAIGSSVGTAIIDGNGFRITLGSDTFNTQYNGAINGVGTQVIKVGKGIQQLATTAGTYTGGTIIREGILIPSLDNRLGASGGVTLDGGTLSNLETSSLTSTRAFTITAAGGTIQTLNNISTATNVANTTNSFTGKFTGPGQLTKTGGGRLSLGNASNDFSGGMRILDGTVSTSAGGTPFGTGSVYTQAEIVLASGASDPLYVVAGGTGSTFTYGPGAGLETQTTASATGATLQIGSVAAASSTLTRAPGGTLTIIPFGGLADLGNTGNTGTARTNIRVGGGVTVTNGIVSPSIVAWNSGGSSTGDYLTYDLVDGFKPAIYSSSELTTAGPTDVVKVTTVQTLLNNRTVYALNTEVGVNGSGTLTIGDGTGAAGLIVNGDGTFSNAGVTFNGTDAAVYVRNTFKASMTTPLSVTGSGGLTKFGLGTLELAAPGTYAGPTYIGAGKLSVIGADDRLPTTTSVTFTGSYPADANSNRATLQLNGTSQHVTSLASDNSYAVVDLGTGTLTVNQNTDTVYRGIFTGGGTFVKAGTGTFKINPLTGGANSTGLLASTYDRIKVTGGIFDFSSFNSLPTATNRLDDMITLDGGGLRWSGSTTFTTTQSSVTTVSTNRGVVLGLGGGTIDVPNPYEILIWQVGAEPTTGSMFSGDGGLTKTGPGFLRFGPGNTYKGKTRVLGGNLQFPRDDSLGQAPDTFVDDQLFIDNGAMIQGNGTGIIKATRGMKIGAGGGVINGGSFIFNGKVSGPGSITKIGGGSISFNADNNTYGGITLTNGFIFFNGQESGGSGTITVDPLFNASIGKSEGPDNRISNPIVLKDGSYIDMRVLSGTGAVVGSIYEGLPIGSLTLAGKITGPGQLFKGLSGGGQGNVVLSNSTNDFTGNFTISTGLVTVTANNALGATSGSTTVNNLGTLIFTGGVNYTAQEPLYLAGPGNAAIDGAVHAVSGANAFAGPVTLIANTTLNVDAGAGLLLSGRAQGAPGAAMTKSGAGKLTLSGMGNNWSGDTALNEGAIDFASTHRIGRLALRTGTIATLTSGNKLLRTTSVDFNSPDFPDASLDLTDGRLIVDYAVGGSTPLSQVRNQIIAAYNTAGAPHWVNPGITSSTAATKSGLGVGYAEASEIVSAGAMWLGEGNIDTSAILVRTTLLGDANLDGATDFLDLARLAQNYNTTVKDASDSWWVRGDFNYDGNVDFLDLALLAQNYNTALPSAPVPGASAGFEADLARAFASVPEPGTLGVMSVAVLAALTRRRRRGA